MDQFVGFNKSFFHLLPPDNWWCSVDVAMRLLVEVSRVRYDIWSYWHSITKMESWQNYSLLDKIFPIWCGFVSDGGIFFIVADRSGFGILSISFRAVSRTYWAPTLFCWVVGFAASWVFWVRGVLWLFATFSVRIWFRFKFRAVSPVVVLSFAVWALGVFLYQCR